MKMKKLKKMCCKKGLHSFKLKTNPVDCSAICLWCGENVVEKVFGKTPDNIKTMDLEIEKLRLRVERIHERGEI